MFTKLLVANRAEIACRVIHTARRLGIRTVAIYSDVDRDALHVKLADEARRVGPPSARDSYLNIDAIIAAARETGTQAIHPGYGFLSENETFARACAQAGIVFVGPTPQAIAAMGDKSAAKALMEKARVPLVPGYHGTRQEPEFLLNEAERIGYPVLIKASAGGGGKGMRVVRSAAEFSSALAGAQREAKASFGDDRILIEKYLERSRHIEVQVFGDIHGNFVYLYERDCSVQRRHQKVLEEAPAPGVTAERRREMGKTAVAAARAIDYTGAGTIEFIAEPGGKFYFMEMNTRLQVEHPVTEMITGFDLVEWQLRIAAGEPLPKRQNEIDIRGHSIEARIYAEDPARNFLPAMGRLAHVAFPEASRSVRVDTGIEAGNEITPYYDPMIAKLIVWGDSRAAALAEMRTVLAATEIAGVTTNVEFLGRVVTSPAFQNADLDTSLIERHRAELFPPRTPISDELLAAATYAEWLMREGMSRDHARRSGDSHSAWSVFDGWRLNQRRRHRLVFTEGEARYSTEIEFGNRNVFVVADREYMLHGERLPNHRLRIALGSNAFEITTVRIRRSWHLFNYGVHRVLELEAELPTEVENRAGGSLAAPMPGKVVAILVKVGARVAKGTPLLILEAMKMEHTIAAPVDGVVREIRYPVGSQVSEGTELLAFESSN